MAPPTDDATRTDHLADGRLVVYLNRDGGTYYANAYLNNSRTNTSSVPKQNSIIPAWRTDDDTWSKLQSCVSHRFAPFAVEVTDVDPGERTPHIEAVIGGRPQDLGLPAGHGGVAPFAWDCSVISNAIVFSFAEVYTHEGDAQFLVGQAASVDLDSLCDTTAQEIAHALGVDHSFNAPDIMSYLSYSEERAFIDEEVQCGEYAGRTCGIGGNVCSETQNTFKLIADRVGLATDRTGDSISLSPDDEAAGCNAGGAHGAASLISLLLAMVLISARRTYMS
ncbi:MAG: hypothetical protein IPL79_10060 [Myxococcales bacterium]|nr:hypothetical protein [Myxococcales bacterium]